MIFLDPDAMRDVIRKTFEKKYPHLVEPNIRTFDRGYNEVVFKTYEMPEGAVGKKFTCHSHYLGYETQEIGGVITAQANSILKDLSGSRQGFLPAFDSETVFTVLNVTKFVLTFASYGKKEKTKKVAKKSSLQGIDYQYCKGCLKCVEACPTDSLTEMREAIGYADENRVKHNFPYVAGGVR